MLFELRQLSGGDAKGLELGVGQMGPGVMLRSLGAAKAFEVAAAQCAAHRAVSLDVVRSRVGECSHQRLVLLFADTVATLSLIHI